MRRTLALGGSQHGKAFGSTDLPYALLDAGIRNTRDWVLTLYDTETGLQVRYEVKD